MPRLAVVALLLLAACSKPRPNVILISIDTLRADRVGRGLTPNLDAFARQSMRFRAAWSHCPLTLPAHASIFTGLLPPEHGVRDNAGYRLDGAKHQTLAATLRANGYRTAAAVSAFVLRRDTGVDAGFEEYDDAIGLIEGAPTGALQRPGRITAKIARDWIAAQSDDAPFFYFLHLYEPHTPYASTYDDDVRDADAIAGELLQFLEDRGLYDDALIVVLSDHGEGLGDHGEAEHGVFLYREALQVPLLIKLPGGKRAGAIDADAQLADVMPTILDALDIESRGTSLLGEVEPRPIYAESFYPRLHLGWSELRSVVRAPMQYIDAPRPELYDLARDPRQKRNLAGEDRRALHALRAQLASFGANFTAPMAVSDEESKKLAALGYVNAGAGAEQSTIDPKDRIGDLEKLKDASIATMQELLAANPQWTDLRDRLGLALAASGDHERAARVFEEGIAATPKLAPSFAISAATELFELGRLDEAEARARFGAESGVQQGYLLLGEIALARGKWDEAAAHAEIARKSAALAPHATFIDARVAAARRDFRTAVMLLSKTQHEQQRSGGSLPRRFHFAAGDVLARLGKMNEARRAFEEEIARDPKNAEAYARLASIHQITGDANAARATLERGRRQGLTPLVTP